MRKTFEPATVVTPAGALSRKDAATYLSCSMRYVDMLAKRGELRRAKIGAKTVFLRTELDQFLQSKMQESV